MTIIIINTEMERKVGIYSCCSKVGLAERQNRPVHWDNVMIKQAITPCIPPPLLTNTVVMLVSPEIISLMLCNSGCLKYSRFPLFDLNKKSFCDCYFSQSCRPFGLLRNRTIFNRTAKWSFPLKHRLQESSCSMFNKIN